MANRVRKNKRRKRRDGYHEEGRKKSSTNTVVLRDLTSCSNLVPYFCVTLVVTNKRGTMGIYGKYFLRLIELVSWLSFKSCQKLFNQICFCSRRRRRKKYLVQGTNYVHAMQHLYCECFVPRKNGHRQRNNQSKCYFDEHFS